MVKIPLVLNNHGIALKEFPSEAQAREGCLYKTSSHPYIPMPSTQEKGKNWYSLTPTKLATHQNELEQREKRSILLKNTLHHPAWESNSLCHYSLEVNLLTTEPLRLHSCIHSYIHILLNLKSLLTRRFT